MDENQMYLKASQCPNCLCHIKTNDQSRVFVTEINRYWQLVEEHYEQLIFDPTCDCKCHEAARIITNEDYA